jgi:thiol-disulfide isomerase/thioredoxin
MRALLILMCCAAAARAETPCEPAPELQSEIASTRGERDATARLKRLLDAHPDDVFVNEAWADQASFEDYAATKDHYRVLHERTPGEPRWAYLNARLVSYASAKEALALTKDLDHPRAFLMRAQRLSFLKDPAGAKKELARYQATCPDALDGWSLRLGLADKKDKAAEVARLRKLLAARTDRAAVAAHSTLWKEEFKNAPPSRHPALRKQVAADLERLRAATKTTDQALLRVFDEGYKLTSNADGQAWVKSQGTDSRAFFATFETWKKGHPNPAEHAPKAQLDAYFAAQFAASAEWVKQYPNELNAWVFRLSSAPRELPVAEVKAIAARMLALDDANAEVASTYAARGIDVDRIPAMVQRNLERGERRWASQRAQPDRFAHMGSVLDEEETTARMAAWDTLSRVYLAQKDAAKLKDVVGKMKAVVDKAKPDDEMRKYHEATYWSARARQAQCEKKKADALGYFLKARALDAGDDDEARALWKDLGGGDDGWTALTATGAKEKAADEGWKTKELALPAMSLTDLAGKVWKSSELKGKTLLLVTWATWCGPCKEELPHLEKLYQQTKKRTDVVVASLNVDFDVGLVEPFIRENKYSFPVLLSSDWASEQRGGGIPLGWIADRTLTVRLERLGYDGSATWVDDTLKAIDGIAKR